MTCCKATKLKYSRPAKEFVEIGMKAQIPKISTIIVGFTPENKPQKLSRYNNCYV